MTLGYDEGEISGQIAVYIVPAGGGTVESDEGTFRAVSPQSPLGLALAGARVGDEVTVGKRAYTVGSVE